jgi:hypothetical protein
MVYCSAGTGGLFLSSVISNFLGIVVKPQFSTSGHSHNLGKGNWKGANEAINFIGNHWDLNFKPNSIIFYAHQGPILELKLKIPNLKVILIDFKEEDCYNITKLYVNKAWPDMWNKEEYDMWRGDDWPAYSNTNIQDSEIIRTDLINQLINETRTWIKEYDKNVVDFIVNFKTVMGIDNSNLATLMSNILDKPVTPAIEKMIDEYQTLNKRLYFNA